jgi:hypothetical protein
MPFIESIDTSNPVIHGLAGVKYKDYGLDEKLSHKVDKFEGDSENWDIALYNVKNLENLYQKINNMQIKNGIEYHSLYEYLGYAAGPELGDESK